MARKGKSGVLEDFGPHLKGLILKAGYSSVEKFALENGFDRVTIFRIIEKGSNPRLSTVIKILKALEISASELIRI